MRVGRVARGKTVSNVSLVVVCVWGGGVLGGVGWEKGNVDLT